MNSNIIEQGDKVFFSVDNQGSRYAVGQVADILDDVIVFQNDKGLFFIGRDLAEDTTVLIEKAETLPEFSGIFGKLVSLVAAIVA
jgi:hypothetical protein